MRFLFHPGRLAGLLLGSAASSWVVAQGAASGVFQRVAVVAERDGDALHRLLGEQAAAPPDLRLVRQRAL